MNGNDKNRYFFGSFCFNKNVEVFIQLLLLNIIVIKVSYYLRIKEKPF